MSRQRWTRVAGWSAAIGGVIWLAKLAVIVANDGRIDDEGAAAFFLLLG